MTVADPLAPEAVLLDLDDTLFDHTLTVRAAIVALRRRHAFLRRPSIDALYRGYLARIDHDTPDVAVGRVTPQAARRARWKAVVAECGVTMAAEATDRLADEYQELYRRVARPVEGAPQAIRRLHRTLPIAVVTNHTFAEQEAKLRFLGLARAVDHLVTPEGIGVAKPGPEIYRAALERLGVVADRATMIGDRWDSDVLGAFAVGIAPIWFNRFHLPRPAALPVAEFDRWIPTPDLAALLRARGPGAVGPAAGPAPSRL